MTAATPPKRLCAAATNRQIGSTLLLPPHWRGGNGVAVTSCQPRHHNGLARCWFCLSPVSRESAPLCRQCLSELSYIPEQRCLRCALPLPGGTLCRECADHPPPFDSACIPLCYDRHSAQLIKSIKRHSHSTALPLLAKLCAESLQRSAPMAERQLVAVPLHPRRTLVRGFCQAALLARAISQQLAPHRPDERSVMLCRHHYQPRQQGQSRRQRLSNLHRAFTANGAAGVAIGLVDDVVTTTATARAAATALRDAGATSVTLVAVARTPKRR